MSRCFNSIEIHFELFNEFNLELFPDLKNVWVFIFLGGMEIFLISATLLAAVFIVLDILNRNRLVEMLQKIYQFDEQISAFIKRRNYKNDKRFITKYILILYLINVTIWISLYFKFSWFQTNQTTLSKTLYLYSNYIILSVATMVFEEYELGLLCIRSRFNSLNTLLRKRFVNQSISIQSIEKSKSNDVSFINSMARLHNLLCDIVDDLNACFSIQIMSNIGMCLLIWIFAVYSLHRTFSYPTESSLQVSAYSCFLLYLYGSHTLIVLKTANSLMNDGKETSNFIHKTLVRVRDDEIKKRLMLFSQQLQHRYPIVSCGFFTVDWPVFFSMIITSATYIITFIQFESPDDNKTIDGNPTQQRKP